MDEEQTILISFNRLQDFELYSINDLQQLQA